MMRLACPRCRAATTPGCMCNPRIGRYGSPSRAALRHALEQVYAGDQQVETDAVLDQLDALGYRLVVR